MKLTKIAGVVLAVLVVATGAAAALPGNAPSDAPVEQADENTSDAEDTDEESQDGDEQADNESDAQASAESGPPEDVPAQAADDRRGPPENMPAQVPEFVGQIHDLIQQKIDGTISNLGEQISSVTPDEESEDSGSGNASAESA